MSEQVKLDEIAAKARAEYVIALFAKDDYDHTRLLHLIPALVADVLALLASRTAPTPPTTPAAAARDALVAACVKRRDKQLAAAAYNGTSLAEYSPLQIAFEIASDELDAAVDAYIAAQEPTP